MKTKKSESQVDLSELPKDTLILAFKEGKLVTYPDNKIIDPSLVDESKPVAVITKDKETGKDVLVTNLDGFPLNLDTAAAAQNFETFGKAVYAGRKNSPALRKTKAIS